MTNETAKDGFLQLCRPASKKKKMHNCSQSKNEMTSDHGLPSLKEAGEAIFGALRPL